MNLVEVLLTRLRPLYALVGLGFFAKRRMGFGQEHLARFLIYIVTPTTMFAGVMNLPDLNRAFWLTPVFYVLCCAGCLIGLAMSRRRFSTRASHILSFGAGNGNSGYFGLPVAMALYGNTGLGYAVLISMGFILYENTLGFYIAARGTRNPSESIRKLLRLPTLYSFALACVLKSLGVHLSPSLADFFANFRGTYSVLGMMMIGMAVSHLEKTDWDVRFVVQTIASKYIVWPLLVGLTIFVNNRIGGFLPTEFYPSMWLAATLPMAANTVAFATEFESEPKKTALAVLVSTLVAAAVIPFFATASF